MVTGTYPCHLVYEYDKVILTKNRKRAEKDEEELMRLWRLCSGIMVVNPRVAESIAVGLAPWAFNELRKLQ